MPVLENTNATGVKIEEIYVYKASFFIKYIVWKWEKSTIVYSFKSLILRWPKFKLIYYL